MLGVETIIALALCLKLEIFARAELVNKTTTTYVQEISIFNKYTSRELPDHKFLCSLTGVVDI